MSELSAAEARDMLLNGGRVRMTVGTDHDDPVLVLWNEDGMIMAHAIAGWSEGIEEAVCEESSNFLVAYLTCRKLESEDDELGWR